jgi:hypothetical protein
LPDAVTREAYAQEVSSVGFWPGDERYPHAAFYSYAYPEPSGLPAIKLRPPAALYADELHEFVLPYDQVRASSDPDAAVLEFAQSVYEGVATLAQWDRQALEEVSLHPPVAVR